MQYDVQRALVIDAHLIFFNLSANWIDSLLPMQSSYGALLRLAFILKAVSRR